MKYLNLLQNPAPHDLEDSTQKYPVPAFFLFVFCVVCFRFLSRGCRHLDPRYPGTVFYRNSAGIARMAPVSTSRSSSGRALGRISEISSGVRSAADFRYDLKDDTRYPGTFVYRMKGGKAEIQKEEFGVTFGKS